MASMVAQCVCGMAQYTHPMSLGLRPMLSASRKSTLRLQAAEGGEEAAALQEQLDEQQQEFNDLLACLGQETAKVRTAQLLHVCLCGCASTATFLKELCLCTSSVHVSNPGVSAACL